MVSAHAECHLRSRLLLGEAGLKRLQESYVVVCGLGGVGSYAAEALARSGLGRFLLVDFDQVSPSNINRQLCALHSTVGMKKTDVVAARLHDIAPDAQIQTRRLFIDEDHAMQLIIGADYVVDAIDCIPGKIALVRSSNELGVPILCAMGAGRRLDPTQLRVADISQTQTCPLARNFRHALRNLGIHKGVEVVYSNEKPQPPPMHEPEARSTIGSLTFVPGAMGLIMASVVVRRLAGLP